MTDKMSAVRKAYQLGRISVDDLFKHIAALESELAKLREAGPIVVHDLDRYMDAYRNLNEQLATSEAARERAEEALRILGPRLNAAPGEEPDFEDGGLSLQADNERLREALKLIRARIIRDGPLARFAIEIENIARQALAQIEKP